MRKTGFAALMASVAVLAWAPSAQGAPGWSSGPIERSYVYNCISLGPLFPAPIVEEGAWTWTSQYLDPNNLPDVNPDTAPNVPGPADANEIFYVSVIAGAVGNVCSGQRVHFEILGLPVPGMSTAISPTYPIYCWALNWNTNPPSAQQEATWPAGACPQFPQAAVFNTNAASFDAATNPGDPADTDPWPMPQGRGWEIQIPVTVNHALSGGFGNCNDCNRFESWIIDGYGSPRLVTSVGLFAENVGVNPGGGSGTNPGDGGTDAGLKPLVSPAPPPPRPPAAATAATGQRADALKKCKKKKSKNAKKKCKKKALKLPV